MARPHPGVSIRKEKPSTPGHFRACRRPRDRRLCRSRGTHGSRAWSWHRPLPSAGGSGGCQPQPQPQPQLVAARDPISSAAGTPYRHARDL